MLPRRHWLPVLILIFGLLASLTTARQLARAEDERAQARFDSLAASAAIAVDNKMDMQIALLRGAAGLFNASGTVSRAEFKAFVDRLNLDRNHPGVLGVGFAAYGADEAAIDAEVLGAREASWEPRHWPDGQRDGYSSILFLEPLDRRNQAAIGYDMMSEPTRRAAMIRAMRTGRTAASGKVRLVQEIDQQKQPGFLIYTPLVARPAAAGEPFRGWVYSPLRGYDLFGSLFAGKDFEAADISVFAGPAERANLLYESAPADPEASHRAVVPLTVAGRTFNVMVSTSPQFGRSSPLPLWLIVAIGGALISVLFAILVGQRERSIGRTERLVNERTRELRQANRRLRDEIDARGAAEAQLHQMQKMESVGQLTGGIAHDFNNMLAVVIGNLDLAQRSASDRKRVDRLISQALKGATSAAELTQRLLAFSRRQTLVPSVIDPNALIGEMSEMLQRAIGETIVIRTELGTAVWPIHADAAQLESTILNLAVNARDAMPDGGTLIIATANATRTDPAAQGESRSAEFVQISVADTGGGMSAEVKERACEPFFTTKGIGQGTGLGLSQVYGFARQSGGFLEIHSEEGQGTTITIGLPRHGEPPIRQSSAAAVNDGGTASGGTILVVEDEDDVRRFSAEALSELGYSVRSAASAEEALTLLAEREVSLVFSDMVMPGMSGRQLAEAALARWPQLRFLFTTGYTDQKMAGNGLPPGAALLRKPFTVEQLAGKVRDVLDR